jgi:hypothetical protein
MSVSFFSDSTPWKRVLRSLALLASVGASVLFVFLSSLRDPSVLRWNVWAYSELLINYRGGFVRRGLLGELLHNAISAAPAIHLVNTLVFVNFAILTIVLLLLVWRAARSAEAMLLATLMPAGLFQMGVWNEYFFRKEILFEIGFGLFALGILLLRRIPMRSLRSIGEALLLAGVLAFTFGAMLVHEGFLFFTIPALCLTVYLFIRNERQLPALALRTALLPAALAGVLFLVLTYFHGGAAASSAIWASLTNTDRLLINPTGGIEGGIAAVGWSFIRALKNPLGNVASGSVWVWASLFALSTLYMAVFVVAIGRRSYSNEKDIVLHARTFLRYYLMFSLCTVPLYLIGWDWGRWMSSTNFHFVMFYMLFWKTPPERPSPVPAAPGRWLDPFVSLVLRHPGAAVSSAIVLSLLTHTPESCIMISKVAMMNVADGLRFLLHAL